MVDQIDHSIAMPVYRQLADWMENQIITGRWQPEERLPGEIELSKMQRVSRGSLRKAIGLLISKNLLVQVHGKGTFVAPGVVEQTWAGRLIAVSEEFMLKGIPFTRKLLGLRVFPATRREEQALDLHAGDPVLSIRRLWLVKGSPGLIHEMELDDRRFHALVEEDLECVSILKVLERRFGVRLEHATHDIAVLRADASLEPLQIKVGDPVLYDEQVTYDDHENKVLFLRGWYRSDRIRLHTVVSRHPSEI